MISAFQHGRSEKKRKPMGKTFLRLLQPGTSTHHLYFNRPKLSHVLMCNCRGCRETLALIGGYVLC